MREGGEVWWGGGEKRKTKFEISCGIVCRAELKTFQQQQKKVSAVCHTFCDNIFDQQNNNKREKENKRKIVFF